MTGRLIFAGVTKSTTYPREFWHTIPDGVDIKIWNSAYNLKVFGRYLLIYPDDHTTDVVITQDDDCALPDWSGITRHYTPGIVTCNVPMHRRPEYSDGIALVGWGAIFDRNLTSVFNLYFKHFPIDDLFITECDRVFTGLNRVQLIDVPFTHLSNAELSDRLHKRANHWDKLREIRERIYYVRKKEGLVLP